jgi:PAS domain S-box-containing protein
MAFTGQSAEEMLGSGWVKAVHPDDAGTAAQRWAQAVARGAPFLSEHRIRRRDGAWRWMRVHAAPVHGPDGRIVEWFGVLVDITESKQAEEALRASEARYRMLHESMRDAFAQVDMQGCIVDCNALYCQMLGYSAEELKHFTYKDLTPRR